jgi:hypothetical protein
MKTRSTNRAHRTFGLIGLGLVSLLAIGGLAACGAQATAQTVPSAKTATLALNILATKPGTQDDGPLYDNTAITLPANALVTVSITDQDPGDDVLPTNSPFGKVTGTVGNTASLDGVPYSSVALDKVGHTFTVPQLGLNVPIPGDVPSGQQAITVTFSFRTGAAGTYMFQCFVPCGDGPTGWDGPMATMGYMMGKITVK